MIHAIEGVCELHPCFFVIGHYFHELPCHGSHHCLSFFFHYGMILMPSLENLIQHLVELIEKKLQTHKFETYNKDLILNGLILQIFDILECNVNWNEKSYID
jgi:hypothetical protein